MKTILGVFLGACIVACGARTDVPDGIEETDSSVPDVVAQDHALPDVTVQDVTVQDVTVQDVTIEDVSVEDVSVDDVSVEDVIEIDAPPPPDGGTACVPDCKHNHECETSCPSLTSGRWCCDLEVGMCYAFAGKHCPAIILDASFD